MDRGRSRVREAEATAVLEAKTASILDFERFVDETLFLSERDRCRLKIAGGEIFDNIVKHAAPISRGRVIARMARRKALGSLLLGFYFRSPRFESFAEAASSADAAAAADAATGEPKPLFDPAHRRWRGIGLVMSRNLARRVRFRHGKAMDRIYLEFD
jgi:hypothetical protein